MARRSRRRGARPLPRTPDAVGRPPTRERTGRAADAHRQPKPATATPRTSTVSDFEDYSSGDSDWGIGSASDDDDGFFPQQVAASSLRDHLLRQLAELNLPLRDRQIVASLIDALDDDGYLHTLARGDRGALPRRARHRSRRALDRASLRAELRARRASARATRPSASTLQLKALPATTPLRSRGDARSSPSTCRCSRRATSRS